MTFSATLSPCFMATKAIWAFHSPKSSLTLLRSESGFASAASFVILARAEAEAYCSKQPFLPHPHWTPPDTRTVWPNSEPAWLNPEKILPLTMTPAPTPVPNVMVTESLAPFAAPATASAIAAQFASLSIYTGRSTTSLMSFLIGALLKGRLLE